MRHTPKPWRQVVEKEVVKPTAPYTGPEATYMTRYIVGGIPGAEVYIATVESESAHARHAFSAPGGDAEGNGALLVNAPLLATALRDMLEMVENVLTDSQLDHEHCGKTIRKALGPAQALLHAVGYDHE